ncbi:MAG: T9SS type A sorting domain-containing protein [Chitinophagales bacterium]
MKSFLTIISFFFTSYCISQVILSEKFESDTLPSGWTQETFASDGGWLLGDNHDLASAIFPIREHGNFIATNDKCFCDKMNDFLMSPSMDFSAYSNIWLNYVYSYVDISPQNFTLEISIDGGASWEELEDLPSSAAGYMGWWEVKFFDLSDYAGFADVKLGFRYSDGGDWWSWGAAIDNFKVFQPLDYDISLDSVYVSDKFSEVGSGITLSGVITNFGTNTIHSFDAIWDDGTTDMPVTISGLELVPFDKTSFTHTIDYVPTEPIPYMIELSVKNPDGMTDMVEADNALDTTVHGCSIKPDKKVVAELATGTWCSWCVRGHVYIDSMYELYPEQFIGIAVHNSDPMELTAYDEAMYAYMNYLNFNGGAGYPSIIADHKYYMDPIEMPEKMPLMMNETPPLALDIYGHYNDTTGLTTIDLKTTFVTRLTPIDYRINLILTEDSVTGTSSGYDQHNAYAGGAYGEMGGYESLPYIIPAEMMQYDHVARYLANGWDGKEDSHPVSVNDGDTIYNHYLVEVDADWNIAKLKIIATVLDYATGEFINANSVKLLELVQQQIDTSGTDTTGVEINTSFITPLLYVYPNPADEVCYISIITSKTINMEIAITDLAGRTVFNKSNTLAIGENNLFLQTGFWAEGIYLLTAKLDDTIITKKVSILH